MLYVVMTYLQLGNECEDPPGKDETQEGFNNDRCEMCQTADKSRKDESK